MNVRDLIPWGRERTPGLRGGEVMDPFMTLQREMNRLFDDAFHGFGFPAGFGAAGWPHTDVAETDKEYRVTAELPGLDEKDVELTFLDGVLTIKGERKLEENGGGDARHTERFYGRFQRSITLGPDVDEDKVTAAYKNGVLTVTLPKKPEAETKVRRIAIDNK